MHNLHLILLLCFITNHVFSQDLYWVNKNGGNFQDSRNWSLTSGGNGGAGVPNGNTTVIFDDNSGLRVGDEIVFEENTDYVVENFYIDSGLRLFTLKFEGSNTNSTTLTIYEDLEILTPVNTSFTSNSFFANKVIINGNGQFHLIETSGIDLNSIEFKDPTGIYSQRSDLYAAARIRMYGGEWDTNGFEVRTDGLLYFHDDQPQSTEYTKQFNAGGSEIHCETYDAKLVYGHLTLSGRYTIFVKKFIGNPSQINNITKYDHVELLNYEPGTSNPIEDNNLDCGECEFNVVTIADADVTRIGGSAIIAELNIENRNNTIQINGGNNRPNYIRLNTVNTPALGTCNAMPTIEGVFTAGITIEAINSSLNLNRLRLKGASAGSVGNYTLSQGRLVEGSTGWTVINPLPSLDFYRPSTKVSTRTVD